eukprot:gene1639-33030_t
MALALKTSQKFVRPFGILRSRPLAIRSTRSQSIRSKAMSDEIVLVSFDVDGTLIESVGEQANKFHKRSFSHGFKTVFDIDTTIDVVQHHGSTDPLIVVKVMEHHGLSREEVMAKLPLVEKAMIEYSQEHTKDAALGLKILPGVEALLTKLKEHGDKVATCLVTGNLEPIGWAKMEALGISHLFTEPHFGGFGSDFCSGNVEESWKDRCTLRHFHVGDTPMDILAADAKGAVPIAVATGIFSKEKLMEVLPAGKKLVMLDNLADIDGFIKELGFSTHSSTGLNVPIYSASSPTGPNELATAHPTSRPCNLDTPPSRMRLSRPRNFAGPPTARHLIAAHASMSSSSFRYRHFTVCQDKCAQKVGTDSMLLGSWTTPTPGMRVLDVGTGCGVLGLMLAQKTQTCQAEIDMIDIDGAACDQARENVGASKWSERMCVHHTSLQDLVQRWERESLPAYGTIISNPPYFSNSTKSRGQLDAAARHADVALPYKDLASCVAKLLRPDGAFFVVLPKPESEVFVGIAQQFGLDLVSRLRIFTKPHETTEKRWLMKLVPKKHYLRASSDNDLRASLVNDPRASSDDVLRASSEDDQRSSSDVDPRASSGDDQRASSDDVLRASSEDVLRVSSDDYPRASSDNDTVASSEDDPRAGLEDETGGVGGGEGVPGDGALFIWRKVEEAGGLSKLVWTDEYIALTRQFHHKDYMP